MTTDPVIVKDMGKQGLAIFLPDYSSNGHIECWGTLLGYTRDEPPGPDKAPMCLCAASLHYFNSGKKPRADDPRVAILIQRYEHLFKVKTRRVFKDTQKFRAARGTS